MNCPTCHHPIPAPWLVCPDCFAQRAWKELQTRQYDPLRQVRARQADFTVRTYKGVRHVQMFFCDVAFCGEAITDKHAKSHITWEVANLGALRGSANLGALGTLICGGCRDALNRLMEEACRPSS